jgi:hypothetical protein
MSNMFVPKSRIVEAARRTDFLSFFRLCFHTLNPSSTLNMNWHHYSIAWHMLSEARRTSTSNLYYSTVASRTDNQHTGAIVVVGQRLHPDDLIGTLLRSTERWHVLTLPAIAEKDEYIPVGPGRWHLRRVGSLLHPEQQSREFLEALKIPKSMPLNISKVPFRPAAS